MCGCHVLSRMTRRQRNELAKANKIAMAASYNGQCPHPLRGNCKFESTCTKGRHDPEHKGKNPNAPIPPKEEKGGKGGPINQDFFQAPADDAMPGVTKLPIADHS